MKTIIKIKLSLLLHIHFHRHQPQLKLYNPLNQLTRYNLHASTYEDVEYDRIVQKMTMKMMSISFLHYLFYLNCDQKPIGNNVLLSHIIVNHQNEASIPFINIFKNVFQRKMNKKGKYHICSIHLEYCHCDKYKWISSNLIQIRWKKKKKLLIIFRK